MFVKYKQSANKKDISMPLVQKKNAIFSVSHRTLEYMHETLNVD